MIEILRKYCMYSFEIQENDLVYCDYSTEDSGDECCEINCPIIKELREKIH